MGVRARSARILIISLKRYEYHIITHLYHCTLENYNSRSNTGTLTRRDAHLIRGRLIFEGFDEDQVGVLGPGETGNVCGMLERI